MGEALFELEQVLRSKKLTSQEANVLMSCKSKAIRDFSVSAGIAGSVVWLATRRFSRLLRVNLTGGIAAFAGLYRFGHALDSCVEHVLGQEGSRMQHELANIMLRRYKDDQSIVQHISKHFYPEMVFDDISVNQPRVSWRYRNFFGDGVSQSENSQESDSYKETTHGEPEPKPNRPKPLHANNNVGTSSKISDPFDYVFGVPSEIEETDCSALSSTLTGRHSRSHKRSRRRQRMLKREANSQYAFADSGYMST